MRKCVLCTIAFVPALVSNGTGMAMTNTSGQVSVPDSSEAGSASTSGSFKGTVERGSRPRMKNKDNSRKLMWWFLGVGGALQLYFVRELLAAFALFPAVFVVFGVVIT